MKVHAYSKTQLSQMIKPTLVVAFRKKTEPVAVLVQEDDMVQARLEEYYALSCSNDLGAAMDNLMVKWSDPRSADLRAA